MAFLIFLPNLLWNIHHHFPFLELQANIRRSGRDVSLSPGRFSARRSWRCCRLTLPVWLAGLWFFFFQPEGKPFRALGWAWLFTAARDRGAEPADLLSLSGVSDVVRGGRAWRGKLAGGAAHALDQAGLRFARWC